MKRVRTKPAHQRLTKPGRNHRDFRALVTLSIADLSDDVTANPHHRWIGMVELANRLPTGFEYRATRFADMICVVGGFYASGATYDSYRKR